MADSLRLSIIQMGAHDMLSPHHSDNEMFYMIEMEKDYKPDMILLPECAWPGYFLSGWDYAMQEKSDDIMHRMAQASRRLGCFIVVGLPEPDKSEPTAQALPFGENWMQPEACRIYNSAIAWNRQGKIVATGRKVNLWHFDGKWFSGGQAPAHFRTRWGKIGLMVCADARLPQLVEELAQEGCRLILNCTNWVTSGPDKTKLTNPQADYLIRVRAAENNLWVASANKAGLEDGLIVFCGSSNLVSPKGEVIVRASSDRTETIRVEIPLDSQGKIKLPEASFEKSGGSADYSSALSIAGDGKQSAKAVGEACIMQPGAACTHPYVAVVQQSPDSAGQPGTGLVARAQMRRLASKIEALGADIVVFSGAFAAMPGPDPQAAALLDERSIRKRILVIPHGKCDKCGNQIGGADVIFDGISLEQYGALARRSSTRGCPNCGYGDSVALAPVVQTPFGPLGLLLGREGHEHRMISNLAGRGVGMFAWITSGLVYEHEMVTRARAMESRVWVATANPSRLLEKEKESGFRSGLSLIAEPDGRVAACAFPNEEQMISAYMDLCLTERVEAVPGTRATR